MNLSIFENFFACCVGEWKAERTYHYLNYQEVERSKTEFTVKPLNSEVKKKVLSDNNYDNIDNLNLNSLLGFNLKFYTISEKGEEVSQELNLLFIPKKQTENLLEGDYLRDRAYEEAKPIISHFVFDSSTKELLMTTNYIRVVSIDSITLINPNLRIRKILNYYRPAQNQPLEKVALVGFGVEEKTH